MCHEILLIQLCDKALRDIARVNYTRFLFFQIFQANYDQFIPVRHRLATHITARYFKIHPVTWYGWVSMRAEFYGCVVGKQTRNLYWKSQSIVTLFNVISQI